MKLNEVFDDVPYRIFQRGEQYYNNDCIVSLKYDSVRNTIKSKVEDSGFRQYSIEVKIKNDQVIDYYCTCTYGHRDICKHLVAVFLAIIKGDHLKTLKNKNNMSYSGNDLYSDDYEDFSIEDDFDSRLKRSNVFDVDGNFDSLVSRSAEFNKGNFLEDDFGFDDDFDSKLKRSNVFDVDGNFDSRPNKASEFNKANIFDSNIDEDFDSRFRRADVFDVDEGFDSRFDRSSEFDGPKVFDVDKGFDSRTNSMNDFNRSSDFNRENGFSRSSDFNRSSDFGRSNDFSRSNDFDRFSEFDRPKVFDVDEGFDSRYENINVNENIRSNNIYRDRLLQSSSKNELIDFILEFSNRDKQLGYEIAKRFRGDNSLDIGGIKKFIKDSIKNDYYGDYLNEEDSYYIANELEEILNQYDSILDGTSCNIIFKNTFEILIETSNILDRNIDEGILTDFRNIIPHAEGLLHTAARYLDKYGTEAQKNNAFCNLIKKGYYKDFKYISNIYFFEIASIFINDYNKNYFYKKFNKFIQKNRNSYEMTSSIVKSIEKDIIKKLQGEDVAHEYMINNIHIDSFAFNIINHAFDNEDYKLAEKICLSKIRTIYNEFPDSKYNTFLKMWYKILHNLYRLAKEEEKKKEEDVIYKLLKNGDSEYYKVLKSLYEKEGIWNEKHDYVIDFIRQNLTEDAYMSILANEREWNLLFDEVKTHPYTISIYGNDLAKVCPEKAFKIFEEEIRIESSTANTRPEYKEVCSLIKKLYENGGEKPTTEILNYLKDTYKERPAFQDELKKLEKNLPMLNPLV